MSEQVRGGRFVARRVNSCITYYYAPFPAADDQTLCPAKDPGTSTALIPISTPSPSALPLSHSSCADPSSAPLLSNSPPHTPSQKKPPDFAATSRPLLLFFAYLGAKPGAVAKYRDLYLDRGMDVLVVRSKAVHFLWPRWGLSYGLEVLKLLEEPQFSRRAVLVHAASIGGYTFTQILTHIALRPKEHAGLTQRVIGHIYDSLVVGTLEHMAIGM